MRLSFHSFYTSAAVSKTTCGVFIKVVFENSIQFYENYRQVPTYLSMYTRTYTEHIGKDVPTSNIIYIYYCIKNVIKKFSKPEDPQSLSSSNQVSKLYLHLATPTLATPTLVTPTVNNMQDVGLHHSPLGTRIGSVVSSAWQ